jgi:hypothetical protein
VSLAGIPAAVAAPLQAELCRQWNQTSRLELACLEMSLKPAGLEALRTELAKPVTGNFADVRKARAEEFLQRLATNRPPANTPGQALPPAR